MTINFIIFFLISVNTKNKGNNIIVFYKADKIPFLRELAVYSELSYIYYSVAFETCKTLVKKLSEVKRSNSNAAKKLKPNSKNRTAQTQANTSIAIKEFAFETHKNFYKHICELFKPFNENSYKKMNTTYETTFKNEDNETKFIVKMLENVLFDQDCFIYSLSEFINPDNNTFVQIRDISVTKVVKTIMIKNLIDDIYDIIYKKKENEYTEKHDMKNCSSNSFYFFDLLNDTNSFETLTSQVKELAENGQNDLHVTFKISKIEYVMSLFIETISDVSSIDDPKVNALMKSKMDNISSFAVLYKDLTWEYGSPDKEFFIEFSLIGASTELKEVFKFLLRISNKKYEEFLIWVESTDEITKFFNTTNNLFYDSIGFPGGTQGKSERRIITNKYNDIFEPSCNLIELIQKKYINSIKKRKSKKNK